MVFRGGRRGRPGLLGTVARTAVVAGTAKATSNAMDRRSQRKASEQQQEYQQEYQQQQPPPQQQVAPVQSVPPSGAGRSGLQAAGVGTASSVRRVDRCRVRGGKGAVAELALLFSSIAAMRIAAIRRERLTYDRPTCGIGRNRSRERPSRRDSTVLRRRRLHRGEAGVSSPRSNRGWLPIRTGKSCGTTIPTRSLTRTARQRSIRACGVSRSWSPSRDSLR